MDLVENKLIILTANDALVTYDLDNDFKKVRKYNQNINQITKHLSLIFL